MSEQRISALPLTVAAAAPISANRAVAHDGTVAAAGAPMYGLAVTQAAPGEALTIETLGSVPATAGAAISVGQALEVGADGKLIPQDTGQTVARALTPAAGDGRVVQVFLIPN